MKFEEIQKSLQKKLQEIYEEREAYNISMLVMEKLSGKNKIEWILTKQQSAPEPFLNQVQKAEAQLLKNRPVQYVLGEAWFMELPFYVEEGVLIPRPETEELVDWIVDASNRIDIPLSILDIGTGSGCIAIALDKYVSNSEVTAFDFSNEALRIAKINKENLKAKVTFQRRNILISELTDFNQKWDIIVSNPPYICDKEAHEMNSNVLQYEPASALFVPDDSPLLFYKKIALLGTSWLKSGGYLYFEINELFGKEIVGLLSDIGYRDVMLKQDLQGKDRMIKALWVVN